MLLGTRWALPALVTLAMTLPVLPAPAGAATDPTPTTMTVTATPQQQYADQQVSLGIDLVDEGGQPIAGATVTEDGSGEVLTTDDTGHAEVTEVMPRRRSRTWSFTYAGDTTHQPAHGEVRVLVERRRSKVTLRGPDSVVDEQAIDLTMQWRSRNGTPVPGRAIIKQRAGDGDWHRLATVRTGHDGTATLTVRPRRDTRYRAVVHRKSWVTGDTSPVHRVDNLPPGEPVRLPDAAPRPRRQVPTQPHAKGAGANPVVNPIPDRVWGQMTGRTWHSGCPVGRAGLRLLHINYWDYQGYRRRGELVAATGAIDNMAGALAAMYRKELPLRSLYREDRFGWSERLHGADDYKSMAAGNTSAFNCRGVVGRPGTLSPHAYGRALDLNTWENPYRSAQGTVPNTWWQHHSHPRVAWRSRSHVVVRVLARHGLRWTYGLGDTQHFDVTSSAAARRMMATDEYVACNEICD